MQKYEASCFLEFNLIFTPTASLKQMAEHFLLCLKQCKTTTNRQWKGHKMIVLRNFTISDVPTLEKHNPSMSNHAVVALVNEWNAGTYQGKYFAMLAIEANDEIVGAISLYAHTSTAIAIGPEIYEAYRNLGYGTQSVRLALAQARKRGYKIAVAQIQTTNLPSLRLHKKLGFEIEHAFVNKKGRQVYFLLRSLV